MPYVGVVCVRCGRQWGQRQSLEHVGVAGSLEGGVCVGWERDQRTALSLALWWWWCGVRVRSEHRIVVGVVVVVCGAGHGVGLRQRWHALNMQVSAVSVVQLEVTGMPQFGGGPDRPTTTTAQQQNSTKCKYPPGQQHNNANHASPPTHQAEHKARHQQHVQSTPPDNQP